jgi:hypothetical protein
MFHTRASSAPSSQHELAALRMRLFATADTACVFGHTCRERLGISQVCCPCTSFVAAASTIAYSAGPHCELGAHLAHARPQLWLGHGHTLQAGAKILQPRSYSREPEVGGGKEEGKAINLRGRKGVLEEQREGAAHGHYCECETAWSNGIHGSPRLLEPYNG